MVADSESWECANCGAPMTLPASNRRKPSCAYCNGTESLVDSQKGARIALWVIAGLVILVGLAQLAVTAVK